MMITLTHYLILAAVLFCIGVFGVVVRRNILIIFMSIELMLSAVNLVFLSFSRYLGTQDGHVWVFMVLTVAAAEAAVGLGIIVALFRNKQTIYVDEVKELKG
ncbi:MAG: NADH-quinone oxidoreductase subunit K [Deltaproteobacteria bacterium RIFCSPLOWO2_12_FULL_44_12]|nr:MAG: NADH-quinone oxidoreductase subunit K [Deltaproteobacteria bacterium RIFCSPHIGHO2_01_FULL_43_49]OGQ14354.1 MAG: NADH-quinone oxidoreductase subunit K [Deltaproteobacteria bacterium RIFCSPHIGHO2_02_FULL_44_53]OGQ27606.1 MAG: NADH-quinone oxidoreductase subunit K [Deltaproteobacteria bacterium RIFCSPHIGHO2_12_FULL_44_21]OGQ30795.1 MAG: NADH-quinone oxidoreductase subunit K [Deltaproteobacteria bacterium RIFCSPLOWO2_01_FULL_45_74]OGQ42475.1 MAG: NADH-quinone oxidoreductase subunit K [Delta